MKVEFKTAVLCNYYLCNYSGKQPFSESILVRFRKVVTYMVESDNIIMLSKFRGLNVEKYEDHWSARINDMYRVEFDFVKPGIIVILKISKHYE